MAWIDDRIWCHPKFTDISKGARWAWVAGVCYSGGFNTRGYLADGIVKSIGATKRERTELVTAGLWHEVDGGVEINDWAEHNDRRDAKREYDRERKKREREADPDSWVVRSGQWQKTRKAVFARDRGMCVDCGQFNDRWHADHVPSRAVLRERGDDPFSLEFIQTRCPRCHSRRHILERTGVDSATDRSDGQTNGPAQADRVTDDSSVTNVTGGELELATSQNLLGRFIDDARAAGVDVPNRTKGHLAKEIKTLLDEGFTTQQVWAGLGRMVERRLVIPSSLGNFAVEAQIPASKTQARYGRGMTTEQILEMGREGSA